MSFENTLRITGILDRIQSLRLFQNRRGRHTLSAGNTCHDIGFDEVIVRRSAGNDQMGSDAALILVNALRDAIQQLRRGISVAIRRSSEDHNGIEGLTAGIGTLSDASRNDGPNEQCRQKAYRNEQEA